VRTTVQNDRIVDLPDWLKPDAWLPRAREATARDVAAALAHDEPGEAQFAALISPAADGALEAMAQRAQELTRRHFGSTISLYVPLYLADYCSAGCVYCGFASDRRKVRTKLGPADLEHELEAVSALGFDDILLLTGDRTGAAGFAYLRDSVARTAARFASVAVEAFTLSVEEYAGLGAAGCTAVTLYQETYDAAEYGPLHRWGPKADYLRRLQGPESALQAGIRGVGLGVLLGLCDPAYDLLSLYRHAQRLRRLHWRSGVSISFPRMRPQLGGYAPRHPVSDRALARYIFAFRLCMPDVPLVLSTRESAPFRDAIAGIGVSRMSIASRTTVGGYVAQGDPSEGGQFDICDERDVHTFCAALRARGLEAVFKNWDAAYRDDARRRAG
jgi:2-iminoacetate synthase